MTRRTRRVAPQPPVSPPSEERRSYGVMSIETPLKMFQNSQTPESNISKAQAIQALRELIFTFINPNTNAKDSDGRTTETETITEDYATERLRTHGNLISLPYLHFISDYAMEIVFTDDPTEQMHFAKTYADELLSERKVETDDTGRYKHSPIIKNVTPENREWIKSHIAKLFIGLHSLLFRNTAVAIRVFEDALQPRQLRFGNIPVRQASTIRAKKLSTLQKLKAKWRKMPIGWKILAGAITIVCIAAVVASFFFPASLALTVPIIGKVAASKLTVVGASSVATMTLAGHATHVACIKIPADKNNNEANNDTHDIEQPSDEPNASQLPLEEQQAIGNAIESTVRQMIIANANATLVEATRTTTPDPSSTTTPLTSPARTPRPVAASGSPTCGAGLFDTPPSQRATDDADTDANASSNIRHSAT